ncbi:hypothetical protein H681_04320 [Pseudomonas sp. ATCC 13867]|nr:hypothetical protein H681_04320 [Pseudomonas sp. ATCC 13867]
MRVAVVLFSAFSCVAVLADEVVAEVPDNTVGGGFGAGAGVLLGGALGGPFGALVGAGVGLFGGSAAQEVSGGSQTSYVVRDAAGHERTVRSPNAEFHVGQQVAVSGDRLRALD